MFRHALASRHQRRCLVIALAITAATVLLNLPWARGRVPGASLLLALELKLIDWRFEERGPRPPPLDVVIAAIDENSIRDEGRWPWPRRRMGEVVRALDAAGARAIVFDIFYTEPEGSAGGAESDRLFAEATERAGNVIHAWFGATDRPTTTPLPPEQVAALEAEAWPLQVLSRPGHELLTYASVTPPLSELTRAARGVGYADLRDSGDGVFRFYDLAAQYKGRLYPSLALSAVARDMAIPPERITIAPGREIRLGDQAVLPLATDGAVLLNFYGPEGTIRRFSVGDALKGRLNGDAVTGKIVLVGVTAKGAYELRPSPFGAVFYGVEMQATAVGNLLDGSALRVSSLALDLVVTLAFGLVVGLGLPLWRPALGPVLSLGLFLGYNGFCAAVFERSGYVMPMAAPNVALVLCVLSILAYRLSTEERHRGRITRTFSLFVPPEVVQQLTAEDVQTARLGAGRREITVLFADIRDFTSYSERHQAEDVVALLNRYFSLMHDIVWRFGGTLDKYMGDGLLAFFGAPHYHEDHPERGVLAAIEMQRQTALHQQEWASFGLVGLKVGIGLHTGEALVGFAGSRGRIQYTCLGTTVNLASRLEELTRDFNEEIIISEAVHERVADVVEAKPIGRTRIRGLSEEVPIYSVLGKKDERRPGTKAGTTSREEPSADGPAERGTGTGPA